MSAYPNIVFSIERVTPARARKYLEERAGNRRASSRTAARYADAIRRGEWVVNGECIKFTTAGQLIDGQHRLLAIVKAGLPADLSIVRGLPEEAFKTMDTGKGRQAADLLYILKYKNPNALARAGRMLHGYERPGWSPAAGRSVSNDQLLATIDKHHGLVESSERYMRKPLFTPLIPHSIGIFVHYLASRVNNKSAQQFFVALADPSTERSKESPARVLRDRLRQTSVEVIKPNSNIKLVWTITSWNHHVGAKSMKRLSRIVDGFPRLDPDPLPVRRTVS